MSDPLQSQHCAERLKALSDPTRLRLVQALRSGPRTVSELAEALSLEVVNVSHHLGILHQVDLVERERQGRFILYRLAKDVFQPSGPKSGLEHLDLGCCRLELPQE
jgi:DNA-binding transcriptional ArsR family regulator